jgi:rare lipoprotein A
MRRFEGGALRAVRLGALALASLALANCASETKSARSKVDPKYGVSASPRVVQPGEPVPKGGGVYRVGQPYLVAGRMYVPEENTRYRAEGTASWYGEDFHGRLTANGEVFDMESIAAAHPTLPLPSYVRVTNLANRRSIVVRVNDRGPYHGNRVIDVSMRAAQALDFHRRGTTRVRVEYVGPAPMEGSDDRRLMATLREGMPAPSPSLVRVASNQPFIPQADKPPVPAERPFETAQRPPAPPPAQAAPPRSRMIADADGMRPSQGWLRSEPDPREALRLPERSPAPAPGPAPAAAFAPAGEQGLSFGRGLY